jgi:hypothetical protein
MSGQPLSRDEVKEIGRSAGRITGGLGYFTGIFGAWALYILTRFLSTGQNPFKEAEAHPTVAVYVTGVIIGIVLTLICATVWGKHDRFPRRPYKMAGSGGSIAAGMFEGFAAFVALVVMILYALTVGFMWLLGTVVVIGTAVVVVIH